MSDERRDRYERAIVGAADEWTLAYGSYTATGRTREFVDAVMAVADEELQKFEDALSKERARAEDAERQRDEARATARRASDYYDEECSLRDEAVRECAQRTADAVRHKADLLTARHDRDEFYGELLATRKELEEARAASALWKELAEKHDASAAPLRHQLRTAERERDRALQARDGANRNAEYYRRQLEALDGVDVDDLKETIVAQAVRLAKLEGEA
ncbi:hypothetical protein ACFY1A_16985 [Streptomyces sp. NPDC001520]|uniref:hypothetical protein n=1 Tax=Streptomyces sp. NPDC001520 TaxID=3364581 RepID=UPI0036BD14C7